MKKIAVLQSNYIPWKGYFDLIAYVDEFIIYDDMQFTKNDWRNRNKIKTSTGVSWLTVPVLTKGKSLQKINETIINGTKWQRKHWNTLIMNYSKSCFFEEISHWLRPLFLENSYSFISVLNRTFIEAICIYLKIKTKISISSDYELIGDKTVRITNLCKQSFAEEYVSGSAAKNYIDTHVFDSSGIKLSWFNYNNYKTYPQLWGEFIHEVSILDLLFNCGPETSKYLKYVN